MDGMFLLVGVVGSIMIASMTKNSERTVHVFFYSGVAIE
jgi:hypothetical protein